MKLARVALAITCFGVTSMSIAQEKIDLRINVKPEDRYEYIVKVKIDGGEQLGSAIAQMHMAQRATSVTSSSIKWSCYVPGMSATGVGILAAAKDALTEMNKLNFSRENSPLGVPIAIGSGSAVINAVGSSSPDVVFPGRPVGVGETWASTMESQGEKINLKFTLTKIKDGLAYIDALLEGGELMKATDPYKYIIDIETGMMVRSSGSVQISQMGMNIGMKFVVERLVPVQRRYPKLVGSKSQSMERILIEANRLSVVG